MPSHSNKDILDFQYSNTSSRTCIRRGAIALPSLKNLGKIRMFRAAIRKIWERLGRQGQPQKIIWAKQIFVHQK